MPEIAASPLPAPAPLQLPGQGLRALDAAAAAGLDLDAHIAELAESGELSGFLSQTDEALDLAAQSPIFAQQLDSLLGRIRDGLGALATERLDAADRERVEQTLSRLDAYLPEPPEAPAAEVPGGGLEAHEDVGGHLIERHVGKSEQWLADRVASENISAASSFRDLPAAEHFVAETLAEHRDRIDAWLDGQGGNRLVVDARFDASTGISVQRGDTRAEDVFSVRLVLERSNALDIGYRIVTGYPTPP
ncbi:RNase A-like domain-containing protein [Luteimonas huabeiensis]|uniref:RNase A-like domain-containing protein n=1 Tax=Luteimonas huabeiensis TaxID=1244513 RepID=UPI000463A38E|nr:RNase A-like domain-containing protein [Luteimonas huabeiensis]